MINMHLQATKHLLTSLLNKSVSGWLFEQKYIEIICNFAHSLVASTEIYQDLVNYTEPTTLNDWSL